MSHVAHSTAGAPAAATPEPAAGPGRRGAGRRSWRVDLYTWWPVIVMAAIIVATSFKSDRYLTVGNFDNIISQAAPLGIATMGQTILLISAGLDLSVAYNLALAAIVAGMMLEHGQALWLAVPAGVAGSTGVGLVNGLLAAQGRAHPFIITLGMSLFLFGFDTQLTGGSPINDMKGLYTAFGGNLPSGAPFFGLPYVVIPFLVVLVLTFVFLRWTPLGRKAFALGGNEQAAYLSGIAIKRTKIYLYTIMGFLVGITGMVLAGQINEAAFNLGQNFDLQSIACAVIGGTALFGGRGGAFRALQGLMLYALVQNSILFAGFSNNYQEMALGLIIIVAVMVTQSER